MTKDLEYILNKPFKTMNPIEIAVLNIHMDFNDLSDEQREKLDSEYLEYRENRGKVSHQGAFR